jgi:hypothetical protein
MSNPTTQRLFSSRNPFRTPILTPNPTGASVTSSAPSYQSALPLSHTLLTPTPTGMSTVSRAPSYHTVVEADAHSYDEDAPEAFSELTPRMLSRQLPSQLLSPLPPPSNNSGSSQSAPPSSPSALPRPTSNSAPPPTFSSPPNGLLPDLTPDYNDIPESAPPAYSLTPDIGDGETIVERGPRRPFQRAPEPSMQPPSPSLQPPSPSLTPEPPLPQMSDFARDFYAAGAEPFPPGPPSPTPSLQQQRRFAPPPGPPPSAAPVRRQSRYAPPRGAPPPTGGSSAASTSSGAGSTSSPARDGPPTTTPTPGRPLLRNGRTLIYPETYLCPKCAPSSLSSDSPVVPSHLTQAAILATRTSTRRARAASAGTALASCSRPFSPRARGVTMAAALRVRASTVARSSARFPRSNPPPHARRPHHLAHSLHLTPHHSARRSHHLARSFLLTPHHRALAR